MGNPRAFRDGPEVAAWLGLVPRQLSSGGKPRLLACAETVPRAERGSGPSATITALQSPHLTVPGVTVTASSPVSSQFADAQPNQAALPFSTND
ncbi:transposase [Caballeronia choica]|uniref:transposase n=1 Tax=Caballeronia choica TaxID=326476 RepID=UPI000F738EBD